MRRLSFLVCALLLCAACSEPPQKEIDMARGAIEAAKAAGAEQYATEPYNAATAALQGAHDAVGQRDYRLALSRALEASERAHEAAKRAGDGKARAQRDSEIAIAAVEAALVELQQKLKTAETARVPARDLQPARDTAAEAIKALQKARAALAAENYFEAGATLGAVRSEIAARIRALDDAAASRPTRPARRRR
jgi:hypothetical protein